MFKLAKCSCKEMMEVRALDQRKKSLEFELRIPPPQFNTRGNTKYIKFSLLTISLTPTQLMFGCVNQTLWEYCAYMRDSWTKHYLKLFECQWYLLLWEIPETNIICLFTNVQNLQLCLRMSVVCALWRHLIKHWFGTCLT